MAYVQDQDGNWIDDGQSPSDPELNPGGPNDPPPNTGGPPYGVGPYPGDGGTPDDPKYGRTSTGADPWGRHIGDPNFGYPPPTGGPTPTPTPTPGPSGGGGGGGSGFPSGRPSNGLMDWGPQFNAPIFDAPAPFSYKDFVAPTLAEAQNAPGYQFGASEGEKALGGSQAAAGVYRTGGALKDLYAWANKFATQNYGNVFNQDSQVYSTNRSNAAQNYATNYGVSRDVFDRKYQGALDEFRPKEAYALGDFARQWDQYQAQLDAQKTLINAGA